jgi:formylmethanofuran dehydrogenase subunit E
LLSPRYSMDDIEKLLARSAANHERLCPRQVLGVRMGLAGAGLLKMELPRTDKLLLVIVETDGCFVSGIEAATGCCVLHRTLRVEDYGKVAASFVDVDSGRAFRLAPRPEARDLALSYAPEAPDSYRAQLAAYRSMPEDSLFSVQAVHLKTPVEAIVGRPGARVTCAVCGEEIMNDRQVTTSLGFICKACAGESYYQLAPEFSPGLLTPD